MSPTAALRISPELQLPVDAITETFGILAVKRAVEPASGVVFNSVLLNRYRTGRAIVAPAK